MVLGLRDHALENQALLPQGIAWTRADDAVLTRLLTGIATEFARIDKRGQDLERESDPRGTTELIGDWERVAGLPDPCVGELAALVARRAAVTGRVSALGGQSRGYFIALAAALGYSITIEEFRPFQAGRSVAGDPLSNGDWIFTWRVHGPETTVRPFYAGIGRAGEPLRTWGNLSLECTFLRERPAQTHVLFSYDLSSGDNWAIGPI